MNANLTTVLVAILGVVGTLSSPLLPYARTWDLPTTD